MRRLEGKTVLLSGGGSGIGKATALAMAEEGAVVAVTDVDARAAEATATEAGAGAFALRLNVASEPDWESAAAAVVQRCGKLDVLVANAGVSHARPLDEMTLDEWRRVMAVNLDGAFLGVKHAIRAMRQGGGGSIVIVSSISGIKASPGAAAYCTSKSALRMLAKAAALECAQKGDRIRVNTVLPGGVKTAMWRSMDFWGPLAAAHPREEDIWRALGSREDLPLARFAEAAEVAQAILYLASDDAALVTGAELVVGGGGEV